MYYRRKILLALLETWGGKLSNTTFQKLLFLFCQLQEAPFFNFVPYKYGCFSFQSYADKRALTYYGILTKNRYWYKIDSKAYYPELEENDRRKIDTLKKNFGNFDQSQLITYVYKNYPYYAAKSEIAEKYLNKNELEKVNREKNTDNSYCLSTIGYEGNSIDCYLNKLIKNNIKLVCDVRKNPISMKYGFSKNQLKEHLRKMGINYLHIPELGIESEKRKNLNSQLEFKKLFKWYEKELKAHKDIYMEKLLEYLRKYRRIALTCFEASHLNCHRHKLAYALTQKITFAYKLTHL
jgi:uncharacterized protein (DUF488 family)